MHKALLGFLFSIPILWLGLHILTVRTGHPWIDDKGKLHEHDAEIQRFKTEFKRFPDSSSEVRIYARAKQSNFSSYDSFGQRIEYLPLGDESYVLTSFGSGEFANTLKSGEGRSLLRGVKAVPQAVESYFPTESRMYFYQAAFLEGLYAPSTKLVATLFVNPRSEQRRILIQDPKRPNFVMSSTHDAVEEFLWLPSGHELVFTAFGSGRYEDGLYYWNLKDNSTHNYTKILRQKFFPELPNDQKLVFSLSHVGGKPQFVYFFAAPLKDGGVDPKDFYRYGNFFAINLALKRTASDTIEKVPSEEDYSIFDYDIKHSNLIALETEGGASQLQKDWLTLPLEGHPEEMLSAWQTFCWNHADSSILPYALWWLASLYNDTFRYLLVHQTSQAQPVKNFGIEIAEALVQHPTAPYYKRAMANNLKNLLLLSKVADYNVTSMEPAGKKAEPK